MVFEGIVEHESHVFVKLLVTDIYSHDKFAENCCEIHGSFNNPPVVWQIQFVRIDRILEKVAKGVLFDLVS